MRLRILLIALGGLLLVTLGGCGYQTFTGPPGSGSQTPQITLNNCPDHPPTISVTTPIPASSAHTIYVSSSGNLYALNAATGAMLWCKQVSITEKYSCPATVSCPPGPFIYWGQPAVADGVVYVCASGYGDGQTYAFRADDGALLWRAASGCESVSTPYGDNAIPLIDHGVVYSGSRALRAQDGKILWSTHAGPTGYIGYMSFHALANGVLYANDDTSVFAVSASDGAVRWKYTPPDGAPPGGSLAFADNRVYYGTLDSIDGAEKSVLYVLDATNGALVWQFSMGAYAGATISNNLIYVSSRDQYLYALQTSDGAIIWRSKFSIPVYNSAVSANGALYITLDGAYALDGLTGKVIWHKPLDNNQSVGFTPVTVVGNVVYLGRTDGEGNSTIYALNAATGATYWHSSEIHQVAPLVVV